MQSQQRDSLAKGVWWWIPTLYFAQGLPYEAVMTMSKVFYKNLGVSNTDIAFYTSLFYAPFVIKPLWSPFIDMFGTKWAWVLGLELLLGAAFAALALTIPLPDALRFTLAMFSVLAFSGATHDIASDGFYMLPLSHHEQAAYVGVRSLFFRMAKLFAQGFLVFVAGKLMEYGGSTASAWSTVFLLMAGIFVALALYHRAVLPRPASDRAVRHEGSVLAGFLGVFVKFLRRRNIALLLAFLLLYRLGESQLVAMAQPFLLDPLSAGGLGLSTANVGLVYGSLGMVMLTVGGIASAWLVARDGLKRWLWPMALAINLPHLVYVWLAMVQPTDLLWVATAVGLEQLGYGFGFTAFILVMIMNSEGEHKTANYAICAGFMAMGMMVPGMFSGKLQVWLGYSQFFIWVCLCAVPCFIATALIKVDASFGKEGS
jgi:PAT family beta-lactamase induction signal transducer AmpG